MKIWAAVIAVLIFISTALLPAPTVHAQSGCPVAVAASTDGWFEQPFQSALENALRGRGVTIIPRNSFDASILFGAVQARRIEALAGFCQVVVANIGTSSQGGWTSMVVTGRRVEMNFFRERRGLVPDLVPTAAWASPFFRAIIVEKLARLLAAQLY